MSQPTGDKQGGGAIEPGAQVLLFVRYLDGLIVDEAEVAAMSRLLASDDSARQLFVELCYDGRLIGETHAERLREPALPQNESFLDALAALDATDEPVYLVDRTDELKAAEADRRKQRIELARRRRAYADKWGLADGKPRSHAPFIIPAPLLWAALVALVAGVGVAGYSYFFASDAVVEVVEDAATVPTRPVVAEIDMMIDAVWDRNRVIVREGERHASLSLRPGTQIRQGDRYILRQGLVQFSTDRGGILVVEAPSEIEFVDENSVLLARGRLVGKCLSTRSEGLRVYTPTAEAVDLGTEFGVHVARDGATDVLTFSGKVELREGPTSGDSKPASIVVGSGQAGFVSAGGELRPTTAPIDTVGLRFAHRMEKRLDVADMVGGGDGLGTGQMYAAIDFYSGALIPAPQAGAKTLNGRYVLAPDLPYVDGVFIPDGGDGPAQINSRGDVFDDLRDTDGWGWLEISNGGFFGQSSGDLSSPRLGGVEYGSVDNPSLNINANAAITFDLAAIRRDHPGMEIKSFSGMCGVSETAVGGAVPLVDFILLLDGRVVYRNDAVGLGGMGDILFSIGSTDRFLTVIVTDGGNGNGADWSLIARPELVLAPQTPE
ncbi:MAG: hypothetical protein ACIAXF_13075 [Phycisphaerales bacterium JB063]